MTTTTDIKIPEGEFHLVGTAEDINRVSEACRRKLVELQVQAQSGVVSFEDEHKLYVTGRDPT